VQDDTPPILAHKHYDAPSAFTPESLLREARRQKGVARLDAWLAWHGDLPSKGDWARLVDEIGVSPEALYREMAKR